MEPTPSKFDSVLPSVCHQLSVLEFACFSLVKISLGCLREEVRVFFLEKCVCVCVYWIKVDSYFSGHSSAKTNPSSVKE